MNRTFLAIIAFLSLSVSEVAAQEWILNEPLGYANGSDSVKIVRRFDHVIERNMAMKGVVPNTYLEHDVTIMMIQFPTNYYTYRFTPYDLRKIPDPEYDVKRYERIRSDYAKDFAGVDFAEYDRKHMEEISQNPNVMQMTRRDFWDKFSAVHKEFVDADAFSQIERAVMEIHDALELDWDGMIHVDKDIFDRTRKYLEEFFVKYADEINPVYLKTKAPHSNAYKVSLNDDFIQMSRMQQKYFPKSHFDRTFTMNAFYSVTQYYLLEKTPYDSIYSSEKKVKERELYLSTRYNQDKLQELDEEYKNEMLNNPNITAIKRGEFWDMVFEFNKRYANSEGFAIIEKSIREAHEALALGWDDVIYIEKNEFDEHKAAVEHIFTDLKDEVNKIYLK